VLAANILGPSLAVPKGFTRKQTYASLGMILTNLEMLSANSSRNTFDLLGLDNRQRA
jgi:hypothetical protein